MNVTFESRGISGRLSSTLEVAVFRIMQEAVHNTAKYALASNVRIDLSLERGTIIAIVEDDGRGFDVDSVLASGSKRHSWGILGIRERTALMGGTFEMKSEVGRGTRLRVEIPTDEARWGNAFRQAAAVQNKGEN